MKTLSVLAFRANRSRSTWEDSGGDRGNRGLLGLRIAADALFPDLDSASHPHVQLAERPFAAHCLGPSTTPSPRRVTQERLISLNIFKLQGGRIRRNLICAMKISESFERLREHPRKIFITASSGSRLRDSAFGEEGFR
jgi:hypothetical protein